MAAIANSQVSPSAVTPVPQPEMAIVRTMKGARILLEALLREDVDTIFGYPGGAVLHIYDELAKMSARLRHITNRARCTWPRVTRR